MPRSSKSHRSLTRFVPFCFTVLVAATVTEFVSTRTGNSRPVYRVDSRRVGLIQPGTVVGTEAPEGWSHLVIKTHLHAGAGDLDRLNDTSKYLASFLFTAFVANVKSEDAGGQRRYHLDRVAVGLGTRIDGKDTIITPETQKKLGADLRLMARVVLNRAHELQHQVYLVARSDTMGVVDTYAAMRRNGKNRQVVFRYALLVDSQTGWLDILVWGIDKDEDGKYTGTFGDLEWLPKNKVSSAVLYVDGDEFTLGMPSENAFAVTEVPSGQKRIALSDELKTVAGAPKLSSDSAYLLETKLRQALQQAAASK